jgi:hypothetical protein
VKEKVVSRPGEGRSKRDLVKEEVARRLMKVGATHTKRLVSLAKLVLSGGDWCLQ